MTLISHAGKQSLRGRDHPADKQRRIDDLAATDHGIEFGHRHLDHTHVLLRIIGDTFTDRKSAGDKEVDRVGEPSGILAERVQVLEVEGDEARFLFVLAPGGFDRALTRLGAASRKIEDPAPTG